MDMVLMTVTSQLTYYGARTNKGTVRLRYLINDSHTYLHLLQHL